MNAIEQGIEINNQHIYNIENGIDEPVSLLEQIQNLGYRDLEDFFNHKREYEMQCVLKGNVYSVTPKNAMPTLRHLIGNGLYGIVSVDTNETCVHHGQDDSKFLDYNYCSVNGIPIYTYDSFGGNIVATKDDYSMAVLLPINIDIDTAFVLSHLKNILDKYFDDVEIQGNDILISNKKVAGTTSFGTGNFFFLIAHFSMSPKDELIRAICGEPSSDKIPGYIDTKILSTEKLKGDLLGWLQGL